MSGCAAHRYECERHGGRPSVRIDSEHFTVTSDLPEDEARVEVRRLERLWDAYSVFFNAEPTTTARVPVLVSQDEAAAELMGDDAIAGFFFASIEPLLVTTVRDWEVGGNIVRTSAGAHELVHLVSRFWLPRQPRWIAEGLAEYLGDAQFKSEDVVRFGRWQWGGGSRVHTLDELWQWDEVVPKDQRSLYESAWAWVHYLANREEGKLKRLWLALRTEPSPRAAFDSVFPPETQAAMHERVEAYVVETRYRGWESRTLRTPELSRAVPLAPWEVHLLRRRILQRTGLAADVERESRLAAEVAPAPMPPEVEVAVAQDTVYGPARTDVLLRHASLPPVMRALGSALDLSDDEQFAWLEKAVAAAPDSAAAELAFARAANARGDARGLDAATRAVALAPWSLDARLAQVRALAGQHRCDEARGSLQSAGSLVDERFPGGAKLITATRGDVDAACEVKP